MDNAKLEAEFLNKIKNAIQINSINDDTENIKDIIKKLEYLEELDKNGGPDYAYNEYYFEKFSIDSSPRNKRKNNKSYSRKKVIDNKVHKASECESEIFSTLTFTGDEIRTNIRYMRQNLKEMIEQKLQRKDKYRQNYSSGQIFGLIIEVEDLCKVYTNEEGEYFLEIRDTSNLKLEKYEIYKDYNLIKQIKSICSGKLKYLIFVENANWNNVIINYIDVTAEIKKENMKMYPDKIFQLCSGCVNVVSMKNVDNTNIQYSIKESTNICSEEIQINGLNLKKYTEPNVYTDDKRLFFFETTQHMLALSPNISEREIIEYFNILVLKQLELTVQEEKYILKRETPLDAYIHISPIQRKGLYRINSNRTLEFSFQEIG